MFDQADIRETDLYREVEDHFTRWLKPSFGKPSGFADVDVHPHDDRVAATGSVLEEFQGTVPMRIVLADGDDLSIVTSGPNSDRFPRFSPDGRSLAFMSDRREQGVFQLYLLHGDTLGEAVAAPAVDGVVEYLSWSPDGSRILLGVAGRGADQAGALGSGRVKAAADDARPAWLPEVSTSQPSDTKWRSAWIYDLGTEQASRVSRSGLNVWESGWASNDDLVAVCSDGDPSEAAWYTADVRLLAVDGDDERVVFTPEDHVGVPAVNPSATMLAIIEAVCSDRGVIAGELRIVDLDSLAVETIDTDGVDVADLQWLGDDRLGYAGLRGFESAYGIVDVAGGKIDERWATTETSGARYPEARWRPDESFAISFESYTRPPSLAIVRGGDPKVLQTTEGEGTDYIRSVAGELEFVTWKGRDGLEIQGLLTKPEGAGPFPLVVIVHGGPVSAYRNRWLMSDYVPLLVKSGYAVLHPNPRGSTGRGVEFARLVEGDMGGEDTYDDLAGIDALAERGVIDPDRVGVTGGSYGGFMSAWLITQDQRFKAAVAMAPVTNWYSQHHTSNIPYFDAIFLDNEPRGANGLAHARSPVMFADRVTTPTLLTAGEHDICTPPTQAIEFHTALTEAGAKSVCCVYPGEGHGVRRFPARIDIAARTLGWFRKHMPA